ncbi:MAG: hypothetical protein RDU89_05010 [bacterium]|nr:hypothetical protein [bacterium]
MAVRTQLKITPNALLRRYRNLALPGQVLVDRDEEVTPDTVVARTEMVPGDPWTVDITRELGLRLTPEQARRAILKRVGDRVENQETLAQYRLPGVLGETRTVRSPITGTVEFVSYAYGRVLIREDARLAQRQVVVNVARQLDVWPRTIGMYLRYREGDEVRQGAALACAPGGVGLLYSYTPVAGVVEHVDRRTGTVVISRPTLPAEVDAYFPGRVHELVPSLGAVVGTRGDHVLGIFGLGFENHGTLRVLVDSPRAELPAEAVTPDCGGKVLVGGAYIGFEALRLALDRGVHGVIVGGADHTDLERLAGKVIGVGMTGQEELSLTVILTEGFGFMPMNRDLFDLLAGAEGSVVSINGTTQVRAGVVRPEIIVHRGLPDRGGGDLPDRVIPPAADLVPGTRVRLLRKPHLGQWGIVVRAGDLAALETEARVTVAEVELENGRRVAVPEANLEVH